MRAFLLIALIVLVSASVRHARRNEMAARTRHTHQYTGYEHQTTSSLAKIKMPNGATPAQFTEAEAQATDVSPDGHSGLFTFNTLTPVYGDHFGVYKKEEIICGTTDPAQRRKSYRATWDRFYADVLKGDAKVVIEAAKTAFADAKVAIDASDKAQPTNPHYGSESGKYAPKGNLIEDMTDKDMAPLTNLYRKAIILPYNDNHFGYCADWSYQEAHQYAAEMAHTAGMALKRGTPLAQVQAAYKKALVAEGCGTHYLTDRFSAGHIRTPRWELRKVCGESLEAASAGLTTNVMHDEDNYQGLLVKNKRGDVWWAFGDDRYFDHENAMNRFQIRRAVQAGLDEIWKAFDDGFNSKPIALANEPLNLVPFTTNLSVRERLENSCPRYNINARGEVLIRVDKDATSIPRPLAAQKEKYPTSMNKYAQRGMPAKFISITTNDLPGPSPNEDCEYRLMTKKDCCVPAGRAKPQFAADGKTYTNKCFLSQKWDSLKDKLVAATRTIFH